MKLNIVVRLLFILFINSLLVYCKKTNNSDSSSIHLYNETYEEAKEEFDGYPDGTYCAEVDYYYSETGTRSSYTLTVEIENNELTVIHWPNNGWLDSSHFYPPDISDGEASFTSDRGVDYNIRIIGNEDEFY